MKFLDVDQNTDEWINLRIGKLTGSSCSKIMASPNEYKILLIEKGVYVVANLNSKKILKQKYTTEIEAHNSLVERNKKSMANRFADPAKKLAIQIAIERITGKGIPSSYSNDHMQRGHEQEPVARAMYEDTYFTDVTNGGFFDCGDTGCSPDGLVGDIGLIEIKSVIATTHYATITRGSFDPAYKWQLYFNLLKTQREWIDFISYCSEFPYGNRLFVSRINKDDCEKEFNMIIEREKEFFSHVNTVYGNIQK